jgi:predicted metal-dependent phosphoesterase TrpH
MLDYDLHCHSTFSDGVLTPTELVIRAAGRGVKMLALTDHDQIDGLAEARKVADAFGIKLINGVEVSVSWRSHTLHIVGLQIDPENAELQAGLHEIRSGRRRRAELMADSLARCGLGGVLDGANRFAANPDIIGRTHFARYLVEAGHCKDIPSVFKRYLVKGKPGYVSHQWANLTDAVRWITQSGGIAVLAHPGRYTAGRKAMGKSTLQELLKEFVLFGGRGVEVVTGSHTQPQYAEFARYATQYGLLSSCGSDFHGPEESYRDLGRLPDLPMECTPVWSEWEAVPA